MSTVPNSKKIKNPLPESGDPDISLLREAAQLTMPMLVLRYTLWSIGVIFLICAFDFMSSNGKGAHGMITMYMLPASVLSVVYYEISLHRMHVDCEREVARILHERRMQAQQQAPAADEPA